MSRLSASQIKENLKTNLIGSEVLVFDEVDSTNDVAKGHLQRDEGLVILADSQTKGKGRLGRSWHSSKGEGIYFSTLLKPRMPLEHLSQLTLMAGVACVSAISVFSKSKPDLKWPNDILLNGKKLAGLLCEYCDEKSAGLIVGIGINVNQTEFPGPLAETATSLRIENGRAVDRVDLIRSLITHLDWEYQAYLLEGALPLMQKWSENTAIFGKKITLDRGGTIFHGTATRLDEQGNLVVLTEEGREVFFDSGEITHVE